MKQESAFYPGERRREEYEIVIPKDVPDGTYQLNEFEGTERSRYFEGKTFSGRFLMETGIDATLGRQFSSRVIRLKKV